MIKHFFESAYIQGKWQQNVLLTINADGRIAHIEKDSAVGAANNHTGLLVAGIANVHSHAFQRAMAGMGEIAGAAGDSFWSWRRVMYDFLTKISPEDLEAIADQLYMEMLKAGFTSVGEFHYLHHQSDGQPYSDRLEMSRRLISSATKTGIGLTLLPVLYSYSGFGAQKALESQRRFTNSADDYLSMISSLEGLTEANDQILIGMAPHSLRGVDEAQLRALQNVLSKGMPIHIHIAEQMKEVNDCVEWSGQRPVEWLLNHADVDSRWSLIHATHINESELLDIANSGATVGLCPITEANLGDGLFPVKRFMDAGGHWGVGSDSNVRISLAEECRILEYGQRLTQQKRTLLSNRGESNGQGLFDNALFGGSRSINPTEKQGLVEGAPANMVVLDAEHPVFTGKDASYAFDSWFFAGGNECVKDVFVWGKQVINEGEHSLENVITERFKIVMKRLADNL
ncbi:MAG: formimidoylglutamate deiminase [Sneathiella sp.]